MIRDIPPLAVEGVDPWEKVQIDPATRRLAEHAAAAAGLGVEEWLERAIRRACPSAFRSASVTIPSTPVIAPTFAAPPAPPRPVAPPPTIAAPPAQPPEIEASLAALLAMAQRQQAQPQQPQSSPQPTFQQPVEARYSAPVEHAPAPLPPLPPIAPVIRQAASFQPAPLPPAPVAEPPAALRRAPTIAERLARQRFDEEESQAEPFAAHDELSNERDDWQDSDAAPHMFAGGNEDDAEMRDRAPKQRFKLWATRDSGEGDARETEPRRVAPLPPSRKSTRRLAFIAVGIALAVAAGAVTAQYLIPGRSHLSAGPSSMSPDTTPIFTPTPSNSASVPNFNGATNAPGSSLPGIPSLPPSPPSTPSSSSPLPDNSGSSNFAPPSSLPPVPGLPSLPPSSSSNTAPTDFAALPPLPPSAPPSLVPAPMPPLPMPSQATQAIPTPVPPLPVVKPEIAAKPELPATAKPLPLAKIKPAPAQAAPTSVAAAPSNGAKTAKIEPNDIAPTDPKALAPWLEQRAKNGDAIAQYRLGVLYALGQGVQQDYQHAAQLFRTSADGGVAEAQYNIAVMYGEGLGIGRDPTLAVQWYQKAAAQGNANAAFNLGVAYSNGVGVQQSMDKAAQWFRRAASAGIVNAQFNLGLLYERGDGVPVSQVEAYAWYNAAATHGDAGAGQRRDHLASTLSPSTLREAQSRAQEIAQEIQNGTSHATNAGNGLTTNAAAAAGDAAALKH